MNAPKRGGGYRAGVFALLGITVLLCGFVLSKAAYLAIPFLLAFFLSLLIYPLVRLGEPYKIPIGIMLLFVLACFAAILVPLVILINVRMQGLLSVLPRYYARLLDIGKGLLLQFNLPSDFLSQFNWYEVIGKYVSNMSSFLLHAMTNIVMICVFMFFMLLEAPNVRCRISCVFSNANAPRMIGIGQNIIAQVSKYIRTLAIISFVTGVCVWIALRLIGVDFALAWAALAFCLNFIPTIGSIIASIPPILIALVQFYPDWIPSFFAFLALLSIQFFIGNIMTPKIMGDALDLSPVVILMSLMFWGFIWGFAGALLSVPIMVIVRIVCENVPQLDFVAALICSGDTCKKRHCASEEPKAK